MSTQRPRVSIGMPVYNGEAFLSEALDSLLGQTFADFELIISDNASTDRTAEICQEYADRDARVRYSRNEQNLGAIGNFNRVFELSDTEYFKWASYDDVCAPTFLQRCVEVLDRDRSIVWCHTRSRHIDPQGSLLDEPDVSYADREADSPHRRFRAVLFDANGCLDSYGLIRSEAILRTPLYMPCYGAEKVFIAELSLWGKFQEVPEILFSARVHSQGSGVIDNAADQQAFMAPLAKQPAGSVRLRLLRGYLSAIGRATLTTWQRIQCLMVLTRYLFQVGKWKRIVTKCLAGSGVGGRNIGRLKNINTQTTSLQDPDAQEHLIDANSDYGANQAHLTTG